MDEGSEMVFPVVWWFLGFDALREGDLDPDEST